MALELLFGRASTDHELALLNRIREIQKSDAEAQIFYVVPNHIKFETEINVLGRLAELDGRHGNTIATPNVQVFSLSRLAWYYMQDDPIYRISNLSSNGLVMLVQDLLRRHKDELVQYAGLLNKQGFVAQFGSQILELKQSGMSWEDVNRMADSLSNAVVLQRKLHDLAVIGQALDEELAKRNQYLSSELLTALKLYLRQDKRDFSHDYYFINGYSQMTTGERGVVEALIAVAGGVAIGLVSDDGAASVTEDAVSENDLFYRPKMLAQQLRRAAIAAEVPVKASTITDLRGVSETYQAVEQFWIDYEQRGIQGGASYPTTPELAVWQTASRYQEIDQLARMIRQEVATGKRRFRDFMLLTRDLGQYENILPAIFARYEIPVFMDLDRPMSAHPLVAFLDKLLSLAPAYNLTDIMAFLKTELLLPADVDIVAYREALALTENYALAKNITGWRWLDETAWQYDYRVTEDDDEVTRTRAAERDAQLAMIHDQITQVVAPFLKRLGEAVDARDMARLLYTFLVENGVKQRLLAWRDEAVAAGNLWAAQQPEQVWRTFNGVMDDFVTVFDKTEMTVLNLQELLSAAFDGANYAGIPATMDQVRVSEGGIVQNAGYHTVVIFGATNTNMPATVRQHALLHDGDRALLADVLPDNAYLRDTAEQEMAQESLLTYNAMMIGQERLIWTYPTSDGEKGQLPSMYVSRLVKQFKVDTTVFQAVPEPTDNAGVIARWVGSIQSTLANLVLVTRFATQADGQLSGSWLNVQRQLQQLAPERFNRLMASLSYQNEPEAIDHNLMLSLFGTDLRTSISRLESYARNPYEFFLQYGLRLQERQVMQLTPAEKGTLMHAVLEGSFADLIANNQVLGALADEDVRALAQRVAADVLGQDDPTYDIFKSTPRMAFLTSNLVDQVTMALLNMKRGQKTDDETRTLGVEAGFGIGQHPLQPVSYDLPQGKVTVRGKVDRYDAVTAGPAGEFVTVVDYKSGKREFKYTQAYEGLELQLMTYWSAMFKNLGQVDADATEVGAAAFWSLQNPWIKAEDLDAESFAEMQAIADERAKVQGQYRGLILGNDDLVETLEGDPTDGHVPAYNIKRTTKGTLTAASDVVSQDDMETLLLFTEAKTRQIAGQILAGHFPLAPYRAGNKTALQYTAYKPVMLFDAMMGDQYHDLTTAGEKNILPLMQDFIDQEGGQH